MRLRERVAACLLLLAGACHYPSTEVLVTVGSDIAPARSIDVRVLVGNGMGAPTSVRYQSTFGVGRDGGTTLPQSFAITPRPGEPLDDAVSLEIQASIAAQDAAHPAAMLTRRARFHFTPHTPTVLPIFLTLACAAPTNGCQHAAPGACTVQLLCDDRGMTCGNDGTCVPIDQTLMPLPGTDAGTVDDIVVRRDSGSPLDVPVGRDVPAGFDATMDDAVADDGVDAGVDVPPDVPADIGFDSGRAGGMCTPTVIAGSTTVEGTMPPTDGRGSAALFGPVYAIRTDHSTNTAVVFDGNSLRRVTLAGDVTTLLTGAALCPFGLGTQFGKIGVDSSGSIYWPCGDGTLHRLTVGGVHTQVPITGAPTFVNTFNVGRDDAVYVVWSTNPGPMMFQPFVARIAPSGAATTVFTGTFTPDVLTRATDIVVGTDHVALVEDPNANVIRRIDLNTGTLLSDLPGFSVANQHLALDAAGDVYAAGREIAPDGRTLSTFPNWTDQFGIDLIGAADDVLQAHCAYITSGWACEINLFHCP